MYPQDNIFLSIKQFFSFQIKAIVTVQNFVLNKGFNISDQPRTFNFQPIFYKAFPQTLKAYRRLKIIDYKSDAVYQKKARGHSGISKNKKYTFPP